MADKDVIRVSLSDVAYGLGFYPSDLKRSFKRFLAVVPEAGNHVEAVKEVTRGGSGGRCITYRMDTVTMCAFLYWRGRRGRLPRFLGVNSCPLKRGGAYGR